MSVWAGGTWFKLRLFAPAMVLLAAGSAGLLTDWGGHRQTACHLFTACGFTYVGLVFMFSSERLFRRLALARPADAHTVTKWRRIGMVCFASGLVLSLGCLVQMSVHRS